MHQMASSSAFMAIILCVLLLTLSPLFFQQTHLLQVEANDRLIQVECHNAQVPATCIQCLNSDKRSQTADKIGIAAIIVGCLSNHASNLVGNMSELASQEQQNVSKKAYEECGQWFSNAKKELAKATQYIKKRDYDRADQSVFNARTDQNSCYSEIIVGSSKIHVPTRVKYEMRIFEDLGEAAMRIIERL